MQKFKKLRPAFLGLAITMFFSINSYASTEGWKLENNTWKYYRDGKTLSSWQKINNNWYFFNNDGSLKTGWLLDGSNWYYLDTAVTTSGALLSGWQWIDGYCYYFEPVDQNTFGKMYSNTVVDGYKLSTLGRWSDLNGKEIFESGKGVSSTKSNTDNTSGLQKSSSGRSGSSTKSKSGGGSSSGGSSSTRSSSSGSSLASSNSQNDSADNKTASDNNDSGSKKSSGNITAKDNVDNNTYKKSDKGNLIQNPSDNLNNAGNVQNSIDNDFNKSLNENNAVKPENLNQNENNTEKNKNLNQEKNDIKTTENLSQNENSPKNPENLNSQENHTKTSENLNSQENDNKSSENLNPNKNDIKESGNDSTAENTDKSTDTLIPNESDKNPDAKNTENTVPSGTDTSQGNKGETLPNTSTGDVHPENPTNPSDTASKATENTDNEKTEDSKTQTNPQSHVNAAQEEENAVQLKAENIKNLLVTEKNDNVVQYVDENGNIRTIIWAKGISAPVMGENGDFRKEVTVAGNDTYIDYKAPYAFGNSWYDSNKTRVGGNTNVDKNLCFGAVASNMLHWWFEQNSLYINSYISKEGDITRSNVKLSDLINSFTDQQNSKIFNLFKVQFGYNDKGFYSDLLMDLFINGYTPKNGGGTNIERENLTPDNRGGFFYKAFKGQKLTERTYGGSYEDLSEKLREILGNDGIIGLSHKTFANSNHIVTLWGAEYDLNGKLTAVYISDSDDQNEEPDETDLGMKRYEVRNVGGVAKVSTNITNKSAGSAIGCLHVLYLGNEQWTDYFNN